MKYLIYVLLLSFSLSISAQEANLAKAANENPFLNGQFNMEYVGQLTALGGEIIEITETKENYPIYKLNLRIKGVNPIWVASLAPPPEGGILVGDMIIFRGYISASNELDESGELEKTINSKSLLLASRADRPN